MEWDVVVSEGLANVGREIVGSDVHGVVGGEIGDVDGDGLVMSEDLVGNVAECAVREIIVDDREVGDIWRKFKGCPRA